MKRFGVFVFPAGLVLYLTAAAFGQAVVEHTTATAAGTAGAAAGGQGVSKSIGGILGNLSKTLEKVKNSDAPQETAGPTQIVAPTAPARGNVETAREAGAPTPAEPAVRKPVRPEFIKIGMARTELVKRVGSPFMKTSRVDSADFFETYYFNAEEDIVVVTLREGRVTDISPPPVVAESKQNMAPKNPAP